MKFTEDDNTDTIETQNPDWSHIEFALRLIDPLNKTFFVLTNDSGSYIQCAGSDKRLTLEFREYESQNVFKHFVIGKHENISPLKTIWTQIDCRVGPIRIYDNEVLTINDAIDIFRKFFNNEKIPLIYKKRNVTKQFEK